MFDHICPSRECELTHREQGIHAWHPEGYPNKIQFLIPIYDNDQNERDRKFMAQWWGVPQEAVITDFSQGLQIEDGQGGWQPFPTFKLAPGWKREQVIEHPEPGITTFGYVYTKEDLDG